MLTIGVNPGQFVVLGSLAFEPSVASTSAASVDSVPSTSFLNELFTVTGATPAPTLVALTPETTGVRVSSAFSAPAATLTLAPEDLTAVQTDLGAVPTQVCIVTQNTALKFGMQRSDGALNAQALRADVHAAANGALTGQIRILGPGNFPPIVLNDIVFNAPPSVNATPSVFTEGQRVLVLLPEPLNVPVITLFESGSTTAIDAVDDVVTQGDGSDPAAVRGAVHNRPGLFVGTLLSFTDGGADGAGSMWVYASHAQAEFMQPASLNIVHQYATRQMVVSCGGPTLLAWDKAQPGTPAPFTYTTPTIAVGSATALSIGSTEAAYFINPGEVVLDQYVIPRVDGSGVYPILIDATVPFYTTAPSAQSVSDDALYAPPGGDFPVGVIPVRPGDTVTQQWPGLVGHAVDTSPLGQSAENTTSNIVYIAVLYNPNASPGSAHGVVVSGAHFETVYTAAAQLEPGAADHLSVQHVVKPLQIDNPCAVIDGNHTVVLLRPELHPLNDNAELIYVPNVVTVCRLDAALRVAPRALPVAPASALLPVLQANTGIQATSLADAVSTQPRVPTHTTYATNCTPWALARASMTTPSISALGFNAAALGLPLIPAQYTLPVVGSDGLSVSLSPRRTFSNNLSLLPSAATLQPSFLLMQDGTVSPIRNTHALPASSQPPHTWCVAPCSNGAWTAVPLHESIGVLQSTVRPDRRSVDAVGRRAGSSTDVPLDSTHVGLNAAYADALTSALQLQHSVQYGALVFDGGVNTGSQPAQPLHARLRNVSSIIPAAFTPASRVNAGAATVDAVYQFTPPLPPNATVPDNPASDEGPGCDAVGFGPLCAISIPVAFEQLFGDWGTPEPILEDVDSGVIDINAVDADVVQRVVDGVQLSALDQRYAQVRGSATRAALYIVGRLVFRHPRAGALDTREFTALFRRNVHRNMHTLDVVAVVYAVYRKALPNTVQRLLNRTPEKFRAAVSVQQELFDSVQ